MELAGWGTRSSFNQGSFRLVDSHHATAGTDQDCGVDTVSAAHFQQPLAIRFLTAAPGPLPTGRVMRIGSLEPVLSAEGVVQADTYLQIGETIRPGRLDGDRRGYVIATADTNVAALDRAEAAARLLTVEVEA